MAGVLIDSRDAPPLGAMLRSYRNGELGPRPQGETAQRGDTLPFRAMLLQDLDTRTLGDTATVDAVVTLPPDALDPAAAQYMVRISSGIQDDPDANPLECRFQVGTGYTPAFSELATAAELQTLLAGLPELGDVAVEVDGPGRPWGDAATPWPVRQWFVRLTPRGSAAPPVLSAGVPLVDQATVSVARTRWWPTELVRPVQPLWPLADTLFAGTFVWCEWKGRAFNIVSHECWEQGQ